jgi:hypothetical protein
LIWDAADRIERAGAQVMDDDTIEQLEAEMSNSLRDLRDFIAGEL